MDKDRGVRIEGFHACQRLSFKFVVHNTRTLPAQHIRAGLLLHVVAQMFIRCPDDLLPETIQMLNEFNGDTGGDHPVCTRFDSGGGVGVNNDGSVRMGIAKRAEFVDRTA
ncbi:hypothetical protein D3C72_1349780 [compost metagenome]